jgi:hypothetical protein
LHHHHLKLNLTPDEIEVRVWGFVVISVTLILCFIVVAFLYSIIFVTQPIKTMAPIDQALLKMLNDVVLLIVGGIGGVMSKRAVSATAKALGTPAPPSPAPSTPAPVAAPVAPSYGQSNAWVAPSGALPEWVNPPLDESWTPGPPPTTPPDHLEDDHDRAQLAAARQEAQ